MSTPQWDQLKKPLYTATEHFLSTNAATAPLGALNLALSVSGTAAATSSVAVTDRAGVAGLQTGTTAAGRCSYSTSLATGTLFSSGAITYTFDCDFQIPISTVGTNAFTIALGFVDSLSLFGSTGSGAFLTTDQSNFLIVNRLVSTSTTTLSALDNSWHNYKVSFNSASAIHTFDGVPTVINSNVPLSTPLGLATTILKSAGTTSRSLNLDFVSFRID